MTNPLIMRRLEMKSQFVLMRNCLTRFPTVGHGVDFKIAATRKSGEAVRPGMPIVVVFCPLLKSAIKRLETSMLVLHYGSMILR